MFVAALKPVTYHDIWQILYITHISYKNIPYAIVLILREYYKEIKAKCSVINIFKFILCIVILTHVQQFLTIICNNLNHIKQLV